MAFISPLPPRLAFHNPAVVIGTWFWVGRLRPAPGTWGSLAALPFAWVLLGYGGRGALLAAAVTAFVLGVWAAKIFTAHESGGDPPSVVIDEVVGQWIALIAAPLTVTGFAAAFLVFRICDILKPWPANWADRTLKNGLGIMLDDVVAGLYALVAVFLVNRWLGV